jgi:hypothetical protein
VGGNKKAEPEGGAVETQVDSRYLVRRMHCKWADTKFSSNSACILMPLALRGSRTYS